ncbi:MAG: histidine kinase [Bacteroidota bacterium]
MADLSLDTLTLLKLKINHILPIAVSLIMPGLSLLSNMELFAPKGLSLIGAWLIASTNVYIFWHLIWNLWSSQPKHRRRFALAGMIGMISFIIYFQFLSNWSEIVPERAYYIFRLFFASLLMVIIQFAMRAQQNISRLQLEKEQIQTENYRVQLSSLRTKIDPHFLFNSLNTLRSMVRQRHPRAEDFVMSLSDFYRKTMKYDENTSLSVSEELEVLEAYLFLMKNRNEEAVSIDINIAQEVMEFQIPTMALQLVIENCFKHNSMSSRKPLQISIESGPDNDLIIRNNLQAKISVEKPSGYGLKMLNKRYEFMKVSEGVIVQKTEHEFIVKLKLINR